MAADPADPVPGAVDELLRAYSTGAVLDDLSPACRPRSVGDARRIHDGLMERLGGHGGWKVGQMQPGKEPGCAPLPANRLLRSPARWTHTVSGPLEIEVEVALTMGQDLSSPGPIGVDAVRAAIDSMHPALEVVSSRFRDRQSLPAFTALADLQANAGLVLGPPTADWAHLDLAGLAMTLAVDGRQVAQVEAGPPQERMLAALTWLANHARDRGMPLRRGDLILTGARIPGTPVPRHARVTARVQGLGEVELGT